MDFIVTDPISPTSSTTSDGTMRAPRSAASGDSAVRKSFSSVLQGARAEEKMGNPQGADSPRGSDKVEDRPDSMQGKGLNSTTTQTEQSEVPHARTSDSETLRDGHNETADGSREEPESALPQGNFVSAAEAEVLVSMISATVLPAEAQTMVSGGQATHNGLQASDCECSPATASSPASMVTAASAKPTESRPLEKETTGLSPDVPEQAKDASLFQKGAESHVKQSTEPKVSESQTDVKGMTTDSVKAPATIQPLLSDGTASSSDKNVARIVQTHEGKLLPERENQNPDALDRGENSAAPRSTDIQTHLLVSDPDDQGDRGTRTQVLAPHGQQLVIDREEPFGQSGHDLDSRQQGNPETKLFQSAVVDLQSMNERTTEHYAAVAQSKAIRVPTAFSPTVTVPSAPPVSPAPDMPQQPISSILRSVVLEVAQPELGHVNIRVAMMNDSVHAHFSTDRVEVGQFLINGQDRLQTTLQASGLDMGQFRVDIDRQNGGRSFQQGLFQEQGQSGHQGSQGVVKEQAQGWSDERSRPFQGRLNVVA